MVSLGLSEAYGSWKTTCTSRRKRAVARPSKPAMSCPRQVSLPSERAVSPAMAMPSVVLPLPLSPTRATVSFASTSRFTPSTACT
jgi:hypothetical protein